MEKTNRQLDLFSDFDEQQFYSRRWGMLQFFPTKSDKWSDCCKHCLLWKRKDEQTDGDECLFAPCNADERTDQKNGYYAIHRMPNVKQIVL